MENYCSWDQIYKDKETNKERGAICYARLFGEADYRKNVAKLAAHFWLENEKAITNADWYLNQFVLEKLPKRISLESITITDVLPDKECIPNRIGYVFWKTLTFDTTKICALDLFVLLTLVRYPQENPKFLPKMWDILGKGKSIDVAWALAHEGTIDNSAHSMMNYREMYDWNPKQWEKYNFSKKWEQIGEDVLGRAVSFYKSAAKDDDISSFFGRNR